MLESLRYRWKLRKLQAERSSLEARYSELIDEKKRNGARDEAQILVAEMFCERDEIDFRIGRHIDSHLWSKAERLLVAFPDDDVREKWDQRYTGGGYYILSNEARSVFHSAILRKRKEMAESRMFIIQIITALTGLGGVAIGLASFCG